MTPAERALHAAPNILSQCPNPDRAPWGSTAGSAAWSSFAQWRRRRCGCHSAPRLRPISCGRKVASPPRGRNQWFLVNRVEHWLCAGGYLWHTRDRPQARSMRQQVANGDLVLALLLAAVGFPLITRPREFRNVPRHWIVEANFALLDQLHHRGGGGNDLGERG